ncbi:tRNA modification GTPase MnmE [Tanacetum coccineum]
MNAVNYYLRANNIKQDDPVINRCVAYLRIGQFLRQRPASASEGRPLSGLDPTTHASVQLGEEGNTAHKRIRKMLPQSDLGSIYLPDSLNERQIKIELVVVIAMYRYSVENGYMCKESITDFEILAFLATNSFGKSQEQMKKFRKLCAPDSKPSSLHLTRWKKRKQCSPTLRVFKIRKSGFVCEGIKWNFTKFLVNKEGKVIAKYGPRTPPLEFEIFKIYSALLLKRHAKSVAAADAALAGRHEFLLDIYFCGFSSLVRSLRAQCIEFLTEIEARLDFDDEMLPLDMDLILSKISAMSHDVESAMETANYDKFL